MEVPEFKARKPKYNKDVTSSLGTDANRRAWTLITQFWSKEAQKQLSTGCWSLGMEATPKSSKEAETQYWHGRQTHNDKEVGQTRQRIATLNSKEAIGYDLLAMSEQAILRRIG